MRKPLPRLGRESVEVVNEFALPVQSRSLTYLLNVAESEAETWMGWGIHVFKVTGGAFKKGTVLEAHVPRWREAGYEVAGVQPRFRSWCSKAQQGQPGYPDPPPGHWACGAL